MASMTEAQMMAGLVQAARTLGYLCFHATIARQSETGFPDLIIVGYGRCFAWECKTARGKLREAATTKRGRYLPSQSDWLNAFAGAGIDARVIRPADYDDALAALQEGTR